MGKKGKIDSPVTKGEAFKGRYNKEKVGVTDLMVRFHREGLKTKRLLCCP